MSDKKIQMLPADKAIANKNDDYNLVASWDKRLTPGINFSLDQITGFTGSGIKSDNDKQTSFGSNTNPTPEGNMFSDGGMRINVYTSSGNEYYTLSYMGDYYYHNKLESGASVSLSTRSSWLRNVCGFACRVNTQSEGSGSAADGCGKARDYRIVLCYADKDNKFRMLDCCAGSAEQKGYHRWDSTPTASADGSPMCYVLGSKDIDKVIDGEWIFQGVILNATHQKTCGGPTKSKNCTARIKNFTPLVKSDKSAWYTNESDVWQYVCVPNSSRTLREVRDNSFIKLK